MKHFVLTLILLVACVAITSGDALASSDPTHPTITQQNGQEVATTKEGTTTPATGPAPALAVGGPGGPSREVFGFALASSLSDSSFGYPSWNFSLLSTVAFFGLHVNNDGTFAGDAGMTVWNSTQLSSMVSAAHSHGTKVVLTIILQDFSPGTPHMCAGLAHYGTTVVNAVNQMKAKGVDGINVDYEGLNGSCGTPNPTYAQSKFVSFVAGLRASMPAGKYLSVDTYASSAADSLGFFDVKGLAPYVDSFFVMAYDLEYSNYLRAPLGCGSFCLGPTAPLTGYYYNDTSVAGQYSSAVGAGKVILGVPYYGRKACVTSGTANQYPVGGVVADSYLDASGEATSNLVQAGSYVAHRDAHDAAGQERWDTWFNTSVKCTRELYWDDAASLGKKYDLVNADKLRGVGLWNLNYGGGAPELWNQLAAHFTVVPDAPPNVSGCAGNGSATVSWSAANSKQGPITGYLVTASPGGATVTVDASKRIASVGGLKPGTAYTLSVQGLNAAGPGVASMTQSLMPSNGTVYTGYFSWFDRATPGMVADNIHLVDPGSGTSSGCVTLTGQVVAPFTLAAGHETQIALPKGMVGGPVVVTVNSGPAVLASQRVQYYSSFNEVWAMSPAQAASVSYLDWFDRVTPGMVADNIHVLNPSAAAANVTVSLHGAAPITFQLQSGAENYVTFPAGRIGGPVVISADQPVLATQRVQYFQSFNEVRARSEAEASATSYFNWFDLVTPGMVADDIHVLNPGGGTATVTVGVNGRRPINLTLTAGAEQHVSFPRGTIGGPVTVSSDVPVLASQRVQYYRSFNESASETATQAQASSYIMWFDRVTPGMTADNIHVLNPGANSANVTVTMAGAVPVTVALGAGRETYISFPAGRIGGPVSITSSSPVLAAQRVQYYSSFNEVPAIGSGQVMTTSYLMWFDRFTAGMYADNIQVFNPSAATASVTVSMPGAPAIVFQLGAGQELPVSFGRGHVGGPVTITSNVAVRASQRVQYYRSFNEVNAVSAGDAATTSYLSWYDSATPGMVGDNIHVFNPGSATAHVRVTVANAAPISLTLAPMAEQHVSFPRGTIGGAVTINSDQPVLASQRVQYFQSFNEVQARSAAQASTSSLFNWFDRATAGMNGDNIHVFNPGATAANVTVSLTGATPIHIALAAGTEQHVTFPAGRIGGPVTVSADHPVLAWQRVQYYSSFNETPALNAGDAQPTSYVMWFDRVTAGMVADNVHVLNPGTTTATVRVILSGAQTTTLTLAPGQETYVTFPAGRIGGPVTICSDVPVLAAQRVQYYSSFNEIGAT